MKKTVQITNLRNTNGISKMCHDENSPIFVKKNSKDDMVIMSYDCYKKLNDKDEKEIILNDKKIETLKKDNNLGFLKVACVNNHLLIGNVEFNQQEIVKCIKQAYKKNAKLILLPELALSSYSAGDLFYSNELLKNVYEGIKYIKKQTEDIDCFYCFGSPIEFENNLYNCAICMHKGHILGIVPKFNVPSYDEFYEKRYFTPYTSNEIKYIYFDNEKIPFGNNILFKNTAIDSEVIGIEICEDMWINNHRSALLSQLGATIICNLSSSNETLYKEETRRNIIQINSLQDKVGYLYCSSNCEESTSDVIFSSHNIICEPDGIVMESNNLFDQNEIINDLNLSRIASLRRKNRIETSLVNKLIIPFYSKNEFVSLNRKYPMSGFIKENHYEEAIKVNLMQAKALIQRLKVISCKDVVIGISGGLDSTIALLALITAYDLMKVDRKHIHAITMPCFGTTNRTKDNATIMCERLNVDLITVNIAQSVSQHLKDIDVSMENRSTTFENAQARERTQVLMDYSNKLNAIVIGTGDLSEIALGWSTYNGDHMSMYNINCSLPKTLIKMMCYELSNKFIEVKDILLDILATPVSPELLPPKDGEIVQLTEEVVGPYELHDYFLYYFIHQHLEIEQVFQMALKSFEGVYEKETLKKWLIHFLRRFFNNQFKRSCCPDGPKITEVSLSPRGDFRMPSDFNGWQIIHKVEKL